MKRVRTRFAPSPTGFMHLGNLRTCLYCYLFAKQNKGDFILRIEDTDQERFVEGAIEKIYKNLKLAGMKVDEGPNEGGSKGPYIQSERKEIYHKYAKMLIDKKVAYYCFCKKDRLEKLKDKNGIKRYDKHCLNLSKEEIQKRIANGEEYVIRQNIPTTGESTYNDLVFGDITISHEEMEDNILIKSDGMPTYNFANVIDDHLMEISHVMRGVEYLTSTPKYNLLYDAFGWERPKYVHMPPIMKNEKQKLSKRFGDANFEDFLNKGYLPEAIINYIALLGWSPKSNQEKMSLKEMIKLFSIEGLSKSGSIFDETKMKWLNGEYIKEMELKKFIKLSEPYYKKSSVSKKYNYKKIAPLLQTRIETFSEIKDKIDFLDKFKEYDVEWFKHKRNKTTLKIALSALKDTLLMFNGVKTWKESTLKECIDKVIQEKGYKKGQVFLSVRLAITGVQSTPGGATEMAEILGKEETLKRMKFSISLLERGIKNEKEN